jgi:general secretion pathway protein G
VTSGSKKRRRLGWVRVVSLIVLACDLASGCSAQREREATLRQNLVTMRQAIDNYTLGKKRVPQSLQDLVNEHYLKEIPTDPFTRKKDWVPELADTVLSADQTMTGIADVHSNSTQVGSNGIAYKDW